MFCNIIIFIYFFLLTGTETNKSR